MQVLQNRNISRCKILSKLPKTARGGATKWIAIAIVAVVIVAAIAASGNGGNKPQKVGNIDNNETENFNSNQSSDDKDKDSVFKKGDIAELNGVKVTLTDYKESNGGDWNKPSEGNIFLVAEFEIENNSKEELAISSILSFEAYADDYKLNYSLGAMMEKDGNQLDGTVSVGKKMKGWIGWEVPEDYNNVEVHFTDNVWGNNKFIFIIER